MYKRPAAARVRRAWYIDVTRGFISRAATFYAVKLARLPAIYVTRFEKTVVEIDHFGAILSDKRKRTSSRFGETKCTTDIAALLHLIKLALRDWHVANKRTRYIDLSKTRKLECVLTIEFETICENNGSNGCGVREKRDAYDGPFSAALGKDGVVFPDAKGDALKAFL